MPCRAVRIRSSRGISAHDHFAAAELALERERERVHGRLRLGPWLAHPVEQRWLVLEGEPLPKGAQPAVRLIASLLGNGRGCAHEDARRERSRHFKVRREGGQFRSEGARPESSGGAWRRSGGEAVRAQRA